MVTKFTFSGLNSTEYKVDRIIVKVNPVNKNMKFSRTFQNLANKICSSNKYWYYQISGWNHIHNIHSRLCRKINGYMADILSI